MTWLDRFLMLLEIVMLWKMLRLDQANSQAIQRFLLEREKWYSRRAILKQTGAAENTKAPETNPGLSEPNEIVTVLEESSNEQDENS